MLSAAARRFGALLAVAAGVTVAGSLLLALVGGASPRRALALGFYLVGSFLLLAGFFVGSRGRARVDTPTREHGGSFGSALGARRVRAATSAEQRETIGASALCIALGLVLLVGGVLADDQHRLF